MNKIQQFVFLLFMVVSFQATAQLKSNSIAPNFTVKDIKGNSYQLYNLLDSGYTCILDFSATWCPPCWAYHESEALKDLYLEHGPGTTDNKVRVFYIEADTSTTLDDLNGIGTDTQGDWVTGTPYPIVDLSTNIIGNLYNITYFPTLYMICPNRILQEIDQIDKDELWAEVEGYCGTKEALFNNDPSIISFNSDVLVCDNLVVKVNLQNNGKAPLTSATLKASSAGLPDITINWTGNLKTYEYKEVNLGNMSLPKSQPVTVSVISTNEFTDNDAITEEIILSKKSNSKKVILKVVCDQYGSDIKWKFISPSGLIIAQGGPYDDETDIGSYPQPDEIIDLLENGCYKFEVTDVYGDGICCEYGDGSISMVDEKNTELFNLNDYKTEASSAIKYLTSSNESELNNSIVTISPNPSDGIIHIQSTSNDITFQITNSVGQIIRLQPNQSGNNWVFDCSNFNSGQYYIQSTSKNKTQIQKITIIK